MSNNTTTYSTEDLSLDLSTATWEDERIWVSGTTDDDKDVTAVFDPVNMDPVNADAEVHNDGITFRAFARLERLYEMETDDPLPVED